MKQTTLPPPIEPQQYRAIEQFRGKEGISDLMLDALAELRYGVRYRSQLSRAQARDMIVFLTQYVEQQKSTRKTGKAHKELAHREGRD